MKITRREFLKSAAGIIVIASLPVSLESCATNDSYRLKYALGDRWKKMPYDARKRTLDLWDKELDKSDKKEFLLIYKNTDKAYAQLDDQSKNWIKNYSQIIKNPSLKETKDYKELEELVNCFPWMDINHLLKDDMIYLNEVAEDIVGVIMSVGEMVR